MAVFVDAMVLEIALQTGMKKNSNAPHIARLEALLDILGYGDFGGQKRFADEIGVNFDDFNQVATGHPLSTIVAFAIKRRFGVNLDFLWDGDYEALPVWTGTEASRLGAPPRRRIFARTD